MRLCVSEIVEIDVQLREIDSQFRNKVSVDVQIFEIEMLLVKSV